MKTFTSLLVRPCWGSTHLALLRRGTRAVLLSFLLLIAAASAAVAAVPNQPAASWASGMKPAGLFTYLTGARWAASSMLVSITRTDVTCAGNDGTITASVTGGVAPYTYLWSNGATTATITGLSAGEYSVVVTDATGATATCNCGDIHVFTPITVIPAIVGVQCSGDPTGSINLSGITGGVAPYTFLWSTGSTAPVLKGVSAGTYTVVITDHNGCTITLSLTVPAATSLLATATRSNTTCAGSANGSIMLAVSGGRAPYSYQWSNGATTQNLAGLPAGTYSVTVTDAGGCSGTTTATILEPAALHLNLTNPRPSCFGGATGGVGIAVSGGTPPYTYLWSNGATTAGLSGVAGGTYTVAVTDANGCTANGSATITQSTQITALVNKTDATCYDASNGIVTLTVSGGTAPLTYLWSNGAITQNLSGLAPGTYTVTVTDANGCTATSGATVGRPAQLLASALATGARCAGGTGSVALTASGGTAPLSYLWSNGAITQNLSGVVAGTYLVTVTDAGGCTATASATVGEPAQLRASARVMDATCYDAANGSVDLTVSGGTAPYTYLWSNGATTQDLVALLAGTYTVTVTDANGCTTTCGGTVGRPTQVLASALATSARCAGGTGSVALTASGGTAPFSYLWSNGATTQSLSGIAAGSYSVTVTDAGGCTATASATVGEPAQLRASARVMDATCYDAANGSVDLTVSGGTAPYTYLWSNGATTQDLVALLAGTYTVTVTDANGCTTTCGGTVGRPTQVLASALATSARCAGGTGSVALTASGGTAPLAYLWSNGATTQNLSGVLAGSYSVTVTDANGCTASASATVGEPAQLRATSVATNTTCYDASNGTMGLTVSGGTAPYSYLWSNGATTQNLSGLAAGAYSVTVTDANGCTATCSGTVGRPVQLLATALATGARCAGGQGSVALTMSGGTAPFTFVWSNGATSQNLNGVSAGTYSVTATDANGCTATASATVGSPIQLRATATATSTTCYGSTNGTMALTVSGGTAPYTYLWSNGATTQNLSSLAAGTYSVTVTDASGCTTTCSGTVGRPTQVLASASATSARCAGGTGSVALTASGGTAPLAYLWSNGATTQNLSGVVAGTYSVTVTDANGCTASASATVGAPAQLRALATAAAASCTGSATGSVTLAVSGGTAPFTYLWSNGATTQNLAGVAPGTYSVTVTDANGCTAGCSATVGGSTAMRPSITVAPATCCASSSGRVDLTVTGGTAPYTYRWSNGATTQDLSNVPAGTYTVTITDASGCTATASGTVTQPAALALRTTLVSPSCCNASTGGIDLAVSGGTAPYTYRWSNGATTQDLSNVSAGTYSVTVTDARGCSASTSVTITQPTALRASSSSTIASCNSSDGTATASASGGTAPYSYRWSPGGQTTATATGLDAGSYTVTITDARGCSATSSTSVLEASCAVQHCTLTQGGYGNSNGVICKEPSKRRLQLIADMFTTSNLVLGAPGRSLTFSYTAGSSSAANLARQATADCIIDKMPAGGSAAAFPSTLGNASGCASSFPSGFLRNGRFNNVLVGQTLALALNLRLDNTLAGVPLSNTMTSYATINCSSPDPRDHTGISRSIPASVLNNLDYGSGTPTVGSLLALANKALGGVAYANGGGNPSLSDINCAVAGINELFDECRILDASRGPVCSARTTSFDLTAVGSSAPATDLRLAVADAPDEASNLVALPNPFTITTTLSFTLPETAKYTLTVYDLKGSEVARVSSGEAQGSVRYRFAVGEGLPEGVYMARLVTATGTQTIRLNLLH